MEFKPLSEQDIKELSLIQKGIYKAQVMRCDQKTSQAGNDYFNLKLRVFLKDGKEKIIYDMMLFEGVMMFKLRHFCEYNGLMEKYNSGKIMPFELEGKDVFIEIDQKVNKKTGELQSLVKDYVPGQNDLSSVAPIENDFFNDAIPFGDVPQ